MARGCEELLGHVAVRYQLRSVNDTGLETSEYGHKVIVVEEISPGGVGCRPANVGHLHLYYFSA